MVTRESDETLLAGSRAKILSLWLDLKLGKIKRDELNQKMIEFLDDLEVNSPEIYNRLQPMLSSLRQEVISDQELKSY